MAFKAAYATDEEIPEHLRDEFVADSEGVFRPTIEAVDGWALEDVTGLKSALSKKTGETRTLTTAQKTMEAERDALQVIIDGHNPGDGDEETAAKIAAIRSQLGETHATELSAVNANVTTLTSQLESALIEQAATAAITNKDIKGNPALLLPIIKNQSRLVRADDGSVSVEIFDTNGPRMNSAADPMSFSDLLTEMKADANYSSAFEGTGASGGGLPARSNGAATGGSYTEEQVAAMSQAEYAKLRSEGKIT